MNNLRKHIYHLFKGSYGDLMNDLDSVAIPPDFQRKTEFLEWINSDLHILAEEFIESHIIPASNTLKGFNDTFDTEKFLLLAKRWSVEYLLKLFQKIDYLAQIEGATLLVIDSPINRIGIESYKKRFNTNLEVSWKKLSIINRLFNLFKLNIFNLAHVLNNGFKFSWKRTAFKAMRESIWGLKGMDGYFFHDNFFVDGANIREQDLLLFSRGIPVEHGRLTAYKQALESPYSHFNLNKLSVSFKQFFSRIIPKYFFRCNGLLVNELRSPDYEFYLSMYSHFAFFALKYERIFSNYSVVSELGHNYFYASHIPEAIICGNFGTKYYLLHWSDTSIRTDKYLNSFLGCDRFLTWGKAHLQGVEGGKEIALETGYIFKRFIHNVRNMREKALEDMGVRLQGKITAFFDESFAGEILMKAEHYVTFWETAALLAEKRPNDTVIIRPKCKEKTVPAELSERYRKVQTKLSTLPNAYIVDSSKWSFVEVIGVSDLTITQGTTSSASIALVCGIPALYFNQAHYHHPMADFFLNQLVFTDQVRLLTQINRILDGNDTPFNYLNGEFLRAYDTYQDDRGLDILTTLLSGNNPSKYLNSKKRVGIILQARMCSTRLPGKVLLPLEGSTVLGHVVTRLRKCKYADEIILATTTNESDNQLEEFALKNGIKCYRGSEENVLSRYFNAALANNLDVIVRITSDCPVIDPGVLDNMIRSFLDSDNFDYLSNTMQRTYPRGLDVEVFTHNALAQANAKASKKYEQEHVTPYIYQHPGKFILVDFKDSTDNSAYRLTVDTAEDYELIKNIYDRLYRSNHDFSLSDIIALLQDEPALCAINANIRQKVTC